eukprot:XP_028342179.1 RNA/RNP complex-1-interacting phosphatase-like isoform X1 [Physeter catodon]
MRSRRRSASCVGLALGSCGSGPCAGAGGAGLATLALLALGGWHLGGHMSQWHRARGRWGQGRGFSGRSLAKRKGGKHIPERYLIDVEGMWPDDAIEYWCFIFTSSPSFHKKAALLLVSEEMVNSGKISS